MELLAIIIGAIVTRQCQASPIHMPTESKSAYHDGIHLPIHVQRSSTSDIRRRDGGIGAVGLGDVIDLSYNVLVTVGTVQIPLVLDTGSSDLWVLSDGCVDACGSKGVPLFPMSEFNYSGVDARLLYGDSTTGTHAFGPIGSSGVAFAGIPMDNQYFAAINNTNTSVISAGGAGILGLGFPINSVIFNTLYENRMDHGSESTSALLSRAEEAPYDHSQTSRGQDYRRSTFPTLPSRLSKLYPEGLIPRQSGLTLGSIQDVLASFASIGPLVSRMAQTGVIASPQVTVTLQRNTIDIGGNPGMLSLGSLPPEITNETLTWVPIRAYTPGQGGLPAPPDSPNEIYPIAWEVHVDGVYLDGVRLPQSNLSNLDIGTTALVDTGNSLIRGPADVVSEIHRRLGVNQQGMMSCQIPHTLAFEIGGQLFPVDPRDLLAPAQAGNLGACWSNVVSTDPPQRGFLYSWSLGDPFLKSTLASFYYGNLTRPSQDPPRMGFVSTVPDNVNELFSQAIGAAAQNGGNFPAMSVPAPSIIPSGAAGYGDPLPTDLKAPSPPILPTPSPSISLLSTPPTVTTGPDSEDSFTSSVNAPIPSSSGSSAASAVQSNPSSGAGLSIKSSCPIAFSLGIICSGSLFQLW